MSLYLVESILPTEKREQAALEQTIDILSEQASTHGGSLIEVQIANDFTRAFFVLESASQSVIREIFGASHLPLSLIKPVRLVGTGLEQLQSTPVKVRYLVEWNLPEGLTMDAYLERKRKSSVQYAQVPEVTFQRTYVCEDMTKCFCLYDGPDEEAIFKARKAVGAPVDTLTETVQISSRIVKK